MPWPRRIPHGEQLSSTSSLVKTMNHVHRREFIERAVLTMVANLDVMPAQDRSPESLVRKASRMYDLIQEEMRSGS